MTDLKLYTELSTLPSDRKKQVQDFIEFLKTKTKASKKIKERKFGYAKDFFKINQGL